MKSELLLFTLIVITLVTSCTTNRNSGEQSFMLTENWKIQESAKTKASGQAISKAEYNTHDWIDAHVPSTVMGILSTQEKYANLFIDDNYYKADKSIFDSSWWYRTTFEAEKPEAGIMWLLQLDGISYSANIWLNGKNIAQKEEVH